MEHLRSLWLKFMFSNTPQQRVSRSEALWSDHHPDSFKGLSVIGGIILCGYVTPRPPEDPVPDPLVLPHIVSPVEVCSHAGIEPPSGAVVGPAVPGRVAVVVSVRGGEGPVVVVVTFAEAQSITCCT